VAIKALACELPATSGRPLSRWQCPDLARAAVEQGIVASISGTAVWRWLSTDAIKPWQHRSWIFPRDPDFAVKAGRILDLYARRWEGKPLEDDEYVISTDEKTSIQARCRCHPTLPPGPGQTMRVEHEYHRKGALAYLAALDVHHARVLGSCEDTSGIVPFSRLVEQVMTTQPYASARRVFFIADNGSSHRGQVSIDRMAKKPGPPPSRCTYPSTHRGSTRSRSTSRSSNAKSLPPTTSTTSTPSPTASSPSRTTGKPPAPRSTGSSPAPTSTTCSPASPPTSRSPPQPDPTRYVTALPCQSTKHRSRHHEARPIAFDVVEAFSSNRNRVRLSPARW
jgi:hypothetical protein